MTEKRAGRPAVDLIKALFAWLFILLLAGVVIAVLSFPTLTLMAAVVLWALTLSGVGL